MKEAWSRLLKYLEVGRHTKLLVSPSLGDRSHFVKFLKGDLQERTAFYMQALKGLRATFRSAWKGVISTVFQVFVNWGRGGDQSNFLTLLEM